MKRVTAAALCMALVLSGCGGKTDDGTGIGVDSVANITGLGNVGISDKFSGLVVSEEEVKIEKTGDLAVREVYVQTGDVVKEGDKLFSYDTDSLKLTLEKQQLELEQLQGTIKSKQDEIKNLNKEKKSAKGTTKLEYTIEIQEAEMDVKEAEYNSKLKEKEIEATEKSMADVDVVSPITGTVKSVKSTGDDDSDDSGMDMMNYGQQDDGSDAFIVLTKSDSFEVKGMINELNAQTLSEGMQLLIRSRIDPEQTWLGTLDRIEWEQNEDNGDNNMGMETDAMTNSSKYPFYVSLEEQDGLMLGQHVYIETNVSGADTSDAAAFMLPSYYIVDVDTDPYVWTENNGKLEKRQISLGEYNADTDCYGVKEGLALTDYIAFPDESCKAGARTTHMDIYTEDTGDAAMDMTDGGEGDMGDAGYVDEEYNEEDSADDAVEEEAEFDEDSVG